MEEHDDDALDLAMMGCLRDAMTSPEEHAKRAVAWQRWQDHVDANKQPLELDYEAMGMEPPEDQP